MKKNNVYFTICGVLEIIAAVMYAFYAIVCMVEYGSFMEAGTEIVDGVEVDYTQVASLFLFLAIAVLVICAVSIFLAWLFLKHRSLSYEEMHQKNGLMVTGIVLAFLFGGILTGVLALIGYAYRQGSFANNDEVYAETVDERITSEYVRKKLDDLKEMLDAGQITEEEYEEMRKNILNKF